MRSGGDGVVTRFRQRRCRAQSRRPKMMGSLASLGKRMNAPLDAAVAPYVLTHTEHGVCRLTLNRGDRYNPLSREMIAALQSEVTRIGADPTIR